MKHQEQSLIANYNGVDEKIISLLSEVISDFGSSKFNWLNGGYKASRIMIRAAIENFIRAISSIEDPSLMEEKRVFELFNKAKDLSLFNKTNQIKDSYLTLHSQYKELCKDTHSSLQENMEHITTLADFPLYKKEKSASTGQIFITVGKHILFLSCVLFNKNYHSMHHKNQQNVIISIPRNLKPAVLLNVS